MQHTPRFAPVKHSIKAQLIAGTARHRAGCRLSPDLYHRSPCRQLIRARIAQSAHPGAESERGGAHGLPRRA